ncbi:unnamed protein product [Scytosiphon promiscuus]
MSSSSEGQDRSRLDGFEVDRSRLDGFEVELFKLVQKEATAEQWREWLRAPLEHAAARGNVNLFTRLMDAGADGGAGWRGCHGRTLLGAAASGKSEEMVLALLEAGAKDDLDIMFQDHSGHQRSALHEAVYGGAEKVCQALMLAGADPNVLDGDGNSPLDLAAGAGYVGIVSDLLLKGACLDTKKNPTNSTPLHLAAGGGHALCVSRLLLSGADMDSLDDLGSTPIALAARNNHLAVVEKLLFAGADTILADDDGFSPLEIAARRGNVAVLKFFLESGGGSISADGEGYTPLHCAAMADGRDGDNSGAIRVLLEAGADVDARTSEGKRPLHYATRGAFESTGPIEALLQEGAEVDARDDTGLTPLHEACCSSDAAAVELLLRWGADETLKHNNGFTVEDFVGHWEGQALVVNEQRRRVDDQRIRRMLARAPADRSWRRRGWLVLCRSRPSRMQLVRVSSSSSSSSSSISKPAKGARLSGVPSAGGDEAGDASKRDPAALFGRVIELKAEDVFRLVVCFL